MEEKFEMSDLGLLTCYLGIEVTQTDGDISIRQSAYANKILKEARMINYNCISSMTGCPPSIPKEAKGRPLAYYIEKLQKGCDYEYDRSKVSAEYKLILESFYLTIEYNAHCIKIQIN
nr:ribonuclease H-like domain, reverse transcriptase, RNA-dependent DNA polymerase [Tanacetum cinerariifolium]